MLLEGLLWDAFGAHASDVRRVLLEVAAALGVRVDFLEEAMRSSQVEQTKESLRRGVEEGRLVLLELPRPPVDTERPPQFIDPFPPAPPPEPEPETCTFELRVVDEIGDPVDGVELVFDVLGRSHQATTDGNGVAKVECEQGSSALVDIVAVHRVREKLAPRWAAPRQPSLPEDTEESPVHLETLDDVFDPIRIRRNRLETLVLMPRFACRELVATTFEFARSFPRRSGIPKLASIAQELRQDDQQLAWVFGHTDLSGPEKLNKRLSERRARAIFALFTHDFDAWNEMWLGKAKESPWFEHWGTREAQHMLNALSCPDDDGNALDEDGDRGSRTRAAIRRFQRGEYSSVPDEQAPLTESGQIDADTRRELFLAYAKLVTRTPVEEDRFSPIGDARFMGCGEFNALSQLLHVLVRQVEAVPELVCQRERGLGDIVDPVLDAGLGIDLEVVRAFGIGMGVYLGRQYSIAVGEIEVHLEGGSMFRASRTAPVADR